MDPQAQFCHNPECAARGKRGEGNIRVHSHKEQRYRCQICGQTFVETKGTAMYRLHKPAETFFIVLVLLSHGCPVQAVVAAFGLDERTVADWIAKTGKHSEQVHQHLVRDVRLGAAALRTTGSGNVINTSYIERLNATFRGRLVGLVRRTRSLARRQELLEAGMWLVGGVYNFCTPHHSLRVEGAGAHKWVERTPAMVAGLTYHVWTMEELMSYRVPLPEWVAPKRRGRPPNRPHIPVERLAA